MDYPNLLRKLEERLTENGAEGVDILSPEETGFLGGLLVMELSGFGGMANEALAEFGIAGAEIPGAAVMMVTVTVLTEIPEENLALVCAETALVNGEIPLGGFAYNPSEGTVIYQLKVPVGSIHEEGELLEEADSCLALSLSMADRYSATIIRCGRERR
ncbi:MAG: YbjN domain-containing protein [Lachnospiraceae bacterium]|nr:YbjN domain-containing protein [Lachnospiraceae bacterium]